MINSEYLKIFREEVLGWQGGLLVSSVALFFILTYGLELNNDLALAIIITGVLAVGILLTCGMVTFSLSVAASISVAIYTAYFLNNGIISYTYFNILGIILFFAGCANIIFRLVMSSTHELGICCSSVSRDLNFYKVGVFLFKACSIYFVVCSFIFFFVIKYT